MKKRIVALSLLATLFVGCGVGCKPNSSSDSSLMESESNSEIEQSVSIEIEGPDTVKCYTQNALTAKVLLSGVETEDAVVWSSSNESILSIGIDGTLIAMNKSGTVTITATHSSGAKATKDITVVDVGSVPSMSFSSMGADNEITIVKGETSMLGAQLEFAGEIVDATFTYTVENEDIIEFSPSNGAILSKAYGVTTISVSVSWRGYQEQVNITVRVVEDVQLFIDGSDVVKNNGECSLQLYTINVTDGDNVYKNTSMLAYSVDAEQEGVFGGWFSTNENVVTVDNNGAITVVAAGEAEIYYKYSINYEYISPKLAVNVAMPVIDRTSITKKVPIDGDKKITIDSDMLLNENDSVEKIVINDLTLMPNADGEFDVSELDCGGIMQIYTSAQYIVETNISLTKAIYTLPQLKAISGVIGGYYVLSADLTIEMSDSMVIETLASTLDLNGFTITYTGTHATLQCVSLIGELAETGVICNGKIVAENIWYNMYSGSRSLVIASGVGLVKNMEINATVAGVVDYNAGFVTMLSADARYENVVIYASNPHTWAMSDQAMNAPIGIFEFGNADTTTITRSIEMKNVIIISNNVNLGAWRSWGRQEVTMANMPVCVNSAMYGSIGEYVQSQSGATPGVNAAKFDAAYWSIDEATGLPIFGLNDVGDLEVQEISTLDELKAISGVEGKQFILQKDLTIKMSDNVVIETLASTLDLNGNTITYTGVSDTLKCVALIGELARTGVICNGKIIAENYYNNLYDVSASLVIASGSGLVKNVEIEATVCGVSGYNTGFVTMLSADARYENVVIYASNPHDWAMSDQTMNAPIGIFDFGNANTTTITTSIQMMNVIIISNNVNLGAWRSWEYQPVTMENIIVRKNSAMYTSIDAYTTAQNDGVAEIDTTKFDAEHWTIDETTGLPIAKINNIQNISTVDDLKAVSGVKGKYFILQNNLTVTMSDSVVIEKLASTLDLNGYTITYTGVSETYGCVALIGELVETGVICNGKIVAGNPWGNWYPGSGSLVITSGKGLVKNMEIEAGINGVMEYNKGLITMLSANARYENVVIYATQYHSWAQSDDSVGGSLGIFDFGNVDTTTIETSIEMKNVVIISDHAHLGAWLSWGRQPVTMENIPVCENSAMYDSVDAYTAAQNDGSAEIDTTKFDTEYWTIDETTGLPTLKSA